jgi:hypothetical protein
MSKSREQSGTRVDGKYWSFERTEDPTRCGRFLDTRERMNKSSHQEAGGRWPCPIDLPDSQRYRELCGLTNKVLLPEDGLILVVSWQAGVPNSIVSLKSAKDMTDEQLAVALRERWDAVKKLLQEYAAWVRR